MLPAHNTYFTYPFQSDILLQFLLELINCDKISKKKYYFEKFFTFRTESNVEKKTSFVSRSCVRTSLSYKNQMFFRINVGYKILLEDFPNTLKYVRYKDKLCFHCKHFKF